MSDHVHPISAREGARYILTGNLVTDTALHVGSGYGSPRTDATVVRDYWERPYIPGSSFKGALRSTVERMIAGLAASAVTSCQLVDGNEICLSTSRERRQAFETMLEDRPEEATIQAFLAGPNGLCDTCWLFGSPYSQSRLLVADLLFAGDAEQAAASEVRHGVGIDRDTLTAREKIKYDFEALPSQFQFRVELVIDRPTSLDLALLALGLQEMRLGFVALGGIRSRGLGRCTLQLEDVRRVDLQDKAAVVAFLRAARPAGTTTARQLAGQALEPEGFISQHLAALASAI